MKAMILAAGRGERMRHLTQLRPKPLLEAGNKPLMLHHLEKLSQAGICDVVINTNYRSEDIRNYLKNHKSLGLNIQFTFEKEILGIGGGINNALPLLGADPFIIISCDIWSDYDYASLLNREVDKAHLILVNNPPFNPRGDFSLHGQKISAYGLAKLNFSGMGIYHPDLFEGTPKGNFPIYPLLKKAADAGQITGEYHSSDWYNVGTPEILQQLDLRLSTR